MNDKQHKKKIYKKNKRNLEKRRGTVNDVGNSILVTASSIKIVDINL